MLKHECRPLFSTPLWIFDLEATHEGLTQMVAMDGRNYGNAINKAKAAATPEKPFNQLDYNFIDFPGYGTEKLKQALTEAINQIAQDRGWGDTKFEYRTRFNAYGPGESDSPHFHLVGNIVGVFCVTFPPNSGDILFYETRGAIYQPWEDTYISTDSKNRTGRVYHRYTPQPGALILFPNYLFHSVETNLSDEHRTSVVIDIRVETKGYDQ